MFRNDYPQLLSLNDEDQLLRKCYRNSLELAVQHGAKSVAFPNISTGVYGFPKERAAMIAIDEVMHFLSAGSGATVERVFFVCYDEENYALYESIVAERS